MTPSNDKAATTSPESSALDEAPEATAGDRETALKDADRLMMQVVQTSLSLIGFGFTINAFFDDAPAHDVALSADLAARRLGLGMLGLGVLFLAMSVWNQTRHRLALARRFRHLPRTREARAYSAAASFTVAACLLLIGLFGLGSIILRSAY